MDKILLTPQENDAIHSLLNGLAAEYKSEEDPRFLRHATVYAHELPQRLRLFLNDFRLSEDSSGVCLISGYRVDDDKIGQTPTHWRTRSEVSPALKEELLLIMYGSLLGEVFGWATEQNGRLVHDVFPIKENENKQISTGSAETIWWHTEDAFHPYSGDYVGLMCLRNPDGVATNYVIVNPLNLSEDEIRILFEPRFVIRPDVAHTESSAVDSQNGHDEKSNYLLESAYKRLQQMGNGQHKMPVLFGSPERPYIRIDPYFMDPLDDDESARRAFNALVRSIDGVLSELVLQPGDHCFLDNYRVVHGRRPFRAKYDGTDRWLKRINITRDLRKSRNARQSDQSRIII